MPPRPGDKTLLVVFADIHYWLSKPEQRPPHHRFEKGSYVYLHQNPSSGQLRLEVANNAGTTEQDAFEGSLEHSRIRYSHKRPGFLTVEVTLRSTLPDQMWQLKSFDLHLQKEYMYLLTAVDIYFWNPADASRFIEAIRPYHVGILDIQDAPQQAIQQTHHRVPSGTISPVVQKLEQVAITNPQQPGQRESSSTIQSLPPPPPPPIGHPSSTSPSHLSGAFAPPPAAYNPAAPAAPEPIAHREKTPPPPEVEAGQQQPGPYGAAYQQQTQSYGQSFSAPGVGRTNSFPPPPPPNGTPPGGISRASTFQTQGTGQQSFVPQSTNAYNPIGAPTGTYSQRQSSSSQPVTQYAGYAPQSPGHPPTVSPLGSPTSLPGPPPPKSPGYNPAAMQSATPPSYSQSGFVPPPPPQQQDIGGQIPQPHEIHSSVYIPSEEEHNKPTPGATGSVGRIEKGVNKWLKRIDRHL